MVRIRKAREDEFALLNQIENIADERYASVGLDIVLGMPTASHASLRAGPTWVACDDGDTPIGFLLAGEIDGYAYVEQISVLPAHGGRGIGSALLATALDWARTTPARALILSTYREVRWNEPFYRRQGFVEMPESEWSDEIRTARRQEAEQGHDLARRLFMWRRLR